MDKKGVIKLGLVFVLLLLLVGVVLSLVLSGAVIDKKVYTLGESVKINLKGIDNYVVKIKTPSTSYVKRGSDDVLIFQPRETGTYEVVVESDGATQNYMFRVVETGASTSPSQTNFPEKQAIRDARTASESANVVSEGFDEFVQGKAEVGKPVKWFKYLNKSEANTFVQIPSSVDLSKVKVFLLENGTQSEIKFDSNPASFPKGLNIEGKSGEYVVEFETPAPQIEEVQLSDREKKVLVYSDLHYKDVVAQTSIRELLTPEQKDLIKVHWNEENKDMRFNAFDSDNNGLLDKVEWVVPHLSNQTFNVSIEILNTHSRPSVGGIWEVRFLTSGRANLTIRAVDGTTWSNETNSEDLKFVEVACGGNVRSYEWINNSVFIENYECNETGYERSRVNTIGAHHLEFDFGGQKAYAHNMVNDFKVQRGLTRVTGTGVVLTAPTDFEAVSNLSRAFVRITGTRHTGSGRDDAQGSANADDVTASIYFINETAIAINRPSTASFNTRVTWEIVEYTGPEGGSNEFVVRKQGEHTFATTGNNETETFTGGINASKMVGFITGVRNPDTGRSDYEHQRTYTYFDNETTMRLIRGTQGTTGDAVTVSYAVVEFEEKNWRIQRVEHHYTSAGTIETETIPTALNDLSKAFIHVQKAIDDGDEGLDEHGQEVWLSSTSQVSFQLESGATTPSGHRGVAWIIENLQSGGPFDMNVQRGTFTKSSGSGTEPGSFNVTISNAVDLNISSVFTNDRSTGPGTAYPRGLFATMIVNSTAIEYYYMDNGQTQNGRWEVVQWPTADDTPPQWSNAKESPTDPATYT
ncbi:hypothetical protein D6817_03620, partial [Candidatus Pacearchaeota archaeon]